MASPPNEDGDFDEEEEDDEVEDGTEASRPCAVASQVKQAMVNAPLCIKFPFCYSLPSFFSQLLIWESDDEAVVLRLGWYRSFSAS